jgi:hypothetical protein
MAHSAVRGSDARQVAPGPEGSSSEQRLLCGIVIAGLAWRVWLAIPASNWDASFVSLLLGALPYGVVAAFEGVPRLTRAALACGAVVLAVDLAAGMAAAHSASSTSSVAVLLAPLVSSVAVSAVLGAWTLSHVLRRLTDASKRSPKDMNWG